MTETQVKVPPRRRWLRIATRILLFLIAAAAIGGVLNRVANSLDRNSRPAGFTRGMLQGALMPMSLPNLLVGRDVTIYSLNNTGVSYKLGYTTGVNACGALFFGFMFWRLNRLRRWANLPRDGQ
ncbi:MAG TPA: hypothetical protein VKY92_26595 [Verrucomicrobiae bacterium]|nr:hypothetical protein [Verrucomicrobiae bacterium]